MRRAFTIALLMTLVGSAESEVFCVNDGITLQDALQTSEANGEDDEIRLVAGAAFVPPGLVFDHVSQEAHDLALSGGWESGGNTKCAVQVVDPGASVLDGEGTRRVFFINKGGSGGLSVSNLTIQNGVGSSVSGGLAISSDSDVTVAGIVVRGVQSGGFNAALDIFSTGEVRVVGNLVVENACPESTCGLSVVANLPDIPESPMVFIVNNTIASNVRDVPDFAAGLNLAGNNRALVANNIIVDNVGGDVSIGLASMVRNNAWGTVSRLTSTDVTGTILLGDPGFLDTPSGDYRLRPDSQLIDAGAALDALVLPAFSLDGSPRTNGSAPDIGAYESQRLVFADGFESPAALKISGRSR